MFVQICYNTVYVLCPQHIG